MDKDANERAGEVGRLNSIKMRSEKEINELMKRIDHYDSVMNEKSK
ncbi:MAG: hypothetical protein M3M88_04655 [Thermoproteota archaeon]|nr:hypothetical protein [Thermoproteota archaeon]